ncbi:MAG: phosphomethylpyrimidine synthase ThiC [Bacteroidales bacterium]|nr:phosphomethylpyrimidine synthase ThiC [Bacteroidales bacterium]
MTQMQYAISGKITDEMLQVAKDEQVSPEWLCYEIAQGTIVLPKNKHHSFKPKAIGKGLSVKINANIGTSPLRCNLNEELEKMNIAIKYGADAIMDLSTGGNLRHILKTIVSNSSVMVGTVPIYSVATKVLNEDLSGIENLDFEDVFTEIEEQAKIGVDFMTLHCGITKRSLTFLDNDKRIMGVVSRGGSIIRSWMMKNNAENPLYEQFDRVLDICETYDVTISLGDGLRPGANADATDRGQIAELLVLGELVERARKRGVQVMVEGPGHMLLDEIEANVKLMKKVCNNAPFYVLGPLTTDIAPGYDHIVGAIGGAIAAVAGADFLCYVTPAEHLSLPTIDDVKEGVIASKIAAHSANLVKNVAGARHLDYEMSVARKNLDWEKMFSLAIDPDKARQKRSMQTNHVDYCSMCGNLCAIKIDSQI